jgi:hypothetical protein
MRRSIKSSTVPHSMSGLLGCVGRNCARDTSCRDGVEKICSAIGLRVSLGEFEPADPAVVGRRLLPIEKVNFQRLEDFVSVETSVCASTEADEGDLSRRKKILDVSVFERVATGNLEWTGGGDGSALLAEAYEVREDVESCRVREGLGSDRQ